MIWCYYINYCASEEHVGQLVSLRWHVKTVWSIMDFCVVVYVSAGCCVMDKNHKIVIWSSHV
jgi:hypothetical protein